MALIVAGATVTSGANLDATKLSGNLPAINGASVTAINGTQITSGTIPNARYGSPTFNGSNITSLPSPSSIIYAAGAVGSFAFGRYSDGGSALNPGSSYGTSGGNRPCYSDSAGSAGSAISGTWRIMGSSNGAAYRASSMHRIS